MRMLQTWQIDKHLPNGLLLLYIIYIYIYTDREDSGPRCL